MNHEKNLSSHTEGLPPLFLRRIVFTSVEAFQAIGIGKNELRKFKTQALMLPLIGLVFVVIPFNVYPAHE
jgi:hypothetical protein